jgi:hypothetical protein
VSLCTHPAGNTRRVAAAPAPPSGKQSNEINVRGYDPPVPAAPYNQPALRPAEVDGEPGIGPLEAPKRPAVMVQFLDLTLHRCRLLAWQRDLAPGVWWCLLQWGVHGELRERWYVYDWQKVRPIPAGLPDLDLARPRAGAWPSPAGSSAGWRRRPPRREGRGHSAMTQDIGHAAPIRVQLLDPAANLGLTELHVTEQQLPTEVGMGPRSRAWFPVKSTCCSAREGDG